MRRTVRVQVPRGNDPFFGGGIRLDLGLDVTVNEAHSSPFCCPSMQTDIWVSFWLQPWFVEDECVSQGPQMSGSPGRDDDGTPWPSHCNLLMETFLRPQGWSENKTVGMDVGKQSQ